MNAHPMIGRRWSFLADKLEVQPELLDVPLQNIRKWKERGHLGNTDFLDRWVDLIHEAQASKAGMEDLLDVLRNNGEETRELKSCSPFAGVLTREERDQFTCAWTH